MGCPAAVELGNNLSFGIATHDPDTGILTDADAVPTYEVYEEDGSVAILSGSMVKRATGKTGRYKGIIACTSANGFEDSKSYTIEILATVDGDEGGISFSFRCETLAAAVGQISGNGAYACTWTVNDGSTALQGAVVAFYLAGVLKAQRTTNASGQASMSLDAWTYTVAITLDGYTFSNETHVVSATASTWTHTFSLTSIGWPASTVPDTTTVRWRVRKTNRAWAGLDDCTVYMGIASGPGVAGTIYNGDNLDFDSDATDASGYVYFANTPKGSTVAGKTATDGQVQFVQIPRDCGDTFEGLELIGSG
jgi:hypothetical protein